MKNKNKTDEFLKWYDLGKKYYNDKKYDEALEYFNKIIEYCENPKDEYPKEKNHKYKYFDTLYYIGKCLFKIQKYDEALEYFNKIIEYCENPKDKKFKDKIFNIYFNALNFKGYTLRKLGRFNEALKCFELTLGLNKDDVWVLNGMGYVYLKIGDYYNAIEYFKKSNSLINEIKYSKKSKDCIYALNGLGYSYAYLKEYDTAKKYFESALKLNKDAYSINGLGYIYSNEGDYESAVEKFKEVLEIDESFYDSVSIIKDFLKNNLTDKGEDIFKEIREIILYLIAFKCRLIVTDTETIYHYSKPTTVENLLNGSNFRLYDMLYMNDPEEGKKLSELIKEKKLELLDEIYNTKIINENEELQVFIGSFTAERDNLCLWIIYGKDESIEDAKGVCIGINKGFFDDIPEHSENFKNFDDTNEDQFCLYYVIYENSDDYGELSKILKNINDIIGNLFKKLTNNEKEIVKTVIKLLLDEIGYLIKSNDYGYEKECRVIKIYNLEKHNNKIKLDNNRIPRLYVEIEKDIVANIKEIILGPRMDNREEWKLCFNYLKYKPERYNKFIKILSSNCKYK